MLGIDKRQGGFAHPLSMSFTFEEGEHSGESYSGHLKICKNPLCSCHEVEFSVEAVEDASLNESGDRARYVFSLDVFKRKVVEKTGQISSKINDNFARSFVGELDEMHWTEIQTAFQSYKAHQTKNCDIETLDPTFPIDQIEYEGTMIAWHDVLPYAEDMSIRDDEVWYYIDDQYCISSTCSCKDVALVIVPIENGVARDGDTSPAIMYNYTNRKWHVEEPRDESSSSMRRIMGKLHESFPDIADTLKERHRILRRLYAKYMRKLGIVSEVPTAKKTGRNEPCPCGSGKKYKICCGR